MRTLGGTLLVLLAATAFGFMPLLWTWAREGGMSTHLLLALRFGLAAVVLGVVVMAQGLAMPKGKVLVALMVMGAAGYFGESICYFLALEQGVPSGVVSLLLYLNPVFVTIGARVLFKERISVLRAIALVVAVAGLGMLLYQPDMQKLAGQGVGIGLGLGCALIYSAYLLSAGRLPASAGPMQSALVIIASAAAMFWAVEVYRLVTGAESVPAFSLGWKSPWAAAGYFAVVCTALPIMALLAGIRMIGSVRASVIAIVEPLTTVMVGVWLLGETATLMQKVGGGLILAGAVMTAVGGASGGGASRGGARKETR